jgi:cysteine desulfurase/selenocysteine lyase
LEIRLEDFPTARVVTYLNSASISLMPRPAIEAMIDFQRQIAGGGTIGFDEEAETRALEDARDEVAGLLGAHRDEIAILSSATEGICSVAWCLSIKRDANIVSTDADFPSVVYPWMRLGREKGCEVRLAKNRDGIVSEEDVEKLVDDKTAVISISHVEYGTGQRFDLRWLSALAHSHGSLLVLDATQSAGLMPIDVHRDGVDALVAGGYKGLLGPFGAAVFFVRQELLEKLVPVLAGWRSTQVPYDLDATKLSFAEGARKFECSTMNYSSPVGLRESVRYLKKLGESELTSHVLSLADRLMQTTGKGERLSGVTNLTPTDMSSHASIVSLRFKDRDQTAIAKELTRRNIIVSQRFNGVRFSFHAYNTEEDISTAVDALEQTLKKTE